MTSSEAEVSEWDEKELDDEDDDLDEDAGDFVDEEDMGKLKPGRPKKAKGKGKSRSKRAPIGSVAAKAHFGTTDSEHQDTVKMLGLKEPEWMDRKLSKYIGQLTNKMPALQYLLYFVPISFWQKVATATNKYCKKWVDEGCGVGEGLDAEDEWDEQLRDTFAESAEGDKKKVKVYGLE